MSEEFIKNLLGNINYEVETDTNWVESLGLDRDTWKALLNYIQQKENIIKEVREYIKNNTYKIEWGDLEQDNEDINISEDLTEKEFIENLLEILDKGE